MALASGTRLGPYEIAAQIGVGGMGEVYQATDTNLKRAVAIKVLPESLAGDTERLARFQREAEVLASLNHPNIAQIHGLEKSDGTFALVMELVEGPTLADLIAGRPEGRPLRTEAGAGTGDDVRRGRSLDRPSTDRPGVHALPVDEALPIAKQIAEALEAAHEQGIIHRDLKPANVKVRQDGTVKVLDFGLAKAMEPAAAMSPSASISPTITTPAMTQMGMILGTAAYMSPEQAKGRIVDARADVWAFGAVLYEMLTGKRAFDGEDTTDVLGAVVRLDPDWAALPSGIPSRIRQVIRACLQKNVKHRIAHIQDVRLALEGAFETTAEAGESPAVEQPMWRQPVPVAAIAAGVAVLVTGLATWTITRPEAVAPSPPRRFAVNAPSATFPANGVGAPQIALSPDGRTLVYVGVGPEGPQLFRRHLEQLTAEPLAGTATGNTNTPFFSPDGQWIGYQTGGLIRKLAVVGGPPQTIIEANPRGATWGTDNNIVYGIFNGGLMRVSANGGEDEVLTTLEEGEVDHRRPDVLPEANAVLFTIWTGSLDTSQIAVLSLETGERRTLLGGSTRAICRRVTSSSGARRHSGSCRSTRSGSS